MLLVYVMLTGMTQWCSNEAKYNVVSYINAHNPVNDNYVLVYSSWIFSIFEDLYNGNRSEIL